MIPLPVEELRGLGELWARADRVTGVEIDSRRVGEGELFVALGGGVDYLGEARAAGAAATLLPADGFTAMAAIGAAVRARTAAQIVGITGSTGKTSTKDILAALCRAAGARTVAAEEGHNNEIGLPLTLMRIEPDTEVAICELGMRGLGQIGALAAVARPHVGVITNIGPVHLESLGTVERVARAKAELLCHLEPPQIAIVPVDPLLDALLPAGVEVRRFGAGDSAVQAFEQREDGSRVRFRLRGRTLELDFSFTARHHATNALVALLALDALGLPLPAGRIEVAFSRWRGEESPLPGGGLLINDAYNANPTSMRAALEHLVARADGRRTVAVLGEMAELGPGAPGFHEEIGAYARELGVDLVLAVGTLARGYGGSAWAEDAPAAVALVRAALEPGDVVLVKASRAVALEQVADALAGAGAR